MKKIQIQDKEFSLFIPESDIKLTIRRIADKINKDFEGSEVVIVPIMNGAMMFVADLVRKLTVNCSVSCVKCCSYQGTSSAGKVKKIVGFEPKEFDGKNVIVVEDIVDTGLTLNDIINQIKNETTAKSISVAAFLTKPQNYVCENLNLNYVGYEISDHFVVGYGMDYNGEGRQYESIYRIK